VRLTNLDLGPGALTGRASAVPRAACFQSSRLAPTPRAGGVLGIFLSLEVKVLYPTRKVKCYDNARAIAARRGLKEAYTNVRVDGQTSGYKAQRRTPGLLPRVPYPSRMRSVEPRLCTRLTGLPQEICLCRSATSMPLWLSDRGQKSAEGRWPCPSVKASEGTPCRKADTNK